MNLKIREFQQAIINFSNKSDLPIEVKRLCMEEIITQLRSESNRILQEEITQRSIKEKQAAEQKESEEQDAESI